MWNVNALRVIGKEFPGGAIPDGLFRIPKEWFEAQGQPVAISSFDEAALDSLSDQLRDLCRASDDAQIRGRFRHIYQRIYREGVIEGFKFALAELSPQPGDEGLIAMGHDWWVLLFITGMNLLHGLSGPQIAAKLGISKQAFFQEVERMTRRLQSHIRRLNQRDLEARNHMRLRNYRSNGRVNGSSHNRPRQIRGKSSSDNR